jgi:hypothetical protein
MSLLEYDFYVKLKTKNVEVCAKHILRHEKQKIDVIKNNYLKKFNPLIDKVLQSSFESINNPPSTFITNECGKEKEKEKEIEHKSFIPFAFNTTSEKIILNKLDQTTLTPRYFNKSYNNKRKYYENNYVPGSDPGSDPVKNSYKKQYFRNETINVKSDIELNPEIELTNKKEITAIITQPIEINKIDINNANSSIYDIIECYKQRPNIQLKNK